MNNYYTLSYLNQELNEKIGTAFFQFAISPHKDVLELYFEISSQRYRLIFSTNPAETAVFLDKYRPPKKRNVIYFFDKIEDQQIQKISLARYDRLLSVLFENEMKLVFKLFSGSPNVFLVEDNTVIDAFKNPEEHIESTPPKPFTPDFKDEVSPRKSPKNQITGFNPLLPRNLIPYLVEQYGVGKMTVDEVKAFTQWITYLLETDPHPRVLASGDVCLWSEKVLDRSSDRTFDSINNAVLHAYRNSVHLRRLHNKKEKVQQLLERTVSKKESLLQQLQQADKSLERADRYEKYAHILMAHAHETLQPGTEEIELSDLYEADKQLTIPLKKGRSIADNAEYYYDKAGSARRSYKEAKRRLPKVKKELERSQKLLQEIKEIDQLWDLEDWLKNHSEILHNLGYGVEQDSQAVSPFRKFQEGKYEIWIGKNAKSNDKLLARAHKEDVWLHARGVGGSHTVIRMGNESSYPPKNVILKAAGYAAFYSKAKGMETAPVMYTKRKYVRKPKGAAPGQVVVEREQVEMVPPTKPTS